MIIIDVWNSIAYWHVHGWKVAHIVGLNPNYKRYTLAAALHCC